MAISGSFGLTWSVKDIRVSDLESGSVGIDRQFMWTVEAGTGANQADRMWQDFRPLTTSQIETLDLGTGLTNLYGTVTFIKVKAISVVADEANTVNVTVSIPATNGLQFLTPASAGLAALKPGCGFSWWDKAGITIGTNDQITITNGAAASSYYIFVLGTSA